MQAFSRTACRCNRRRSAKLGGNTPTVQAQQAVICDSNKIDSNDSLGEEMRSDNIINKNLAELPTEEDGIWPARYPAYHVTQKRSKIYQFDK